MRQLGDAVAQLPFAILMGVAVAALPIAVAVTLAIIHLFRSRVKRSMAARGGTASPADPHPAPGDEVRQAAELQPIEPTRERAKAARALPLMAELRWQIRTQAGIYAATTAAWSLLLAAVYVLTIDFSPTSDIVLKYAMLFSLFPACARDAHGPGAGDRAQRAPPSPGWLGSRAARCDVGVRSQHWDRRYRDDLADDRRCTHGSDPDPAHTSSSRGRPRRLCGHANAALRILCRRDIRRRLRVGRRRASSVSSRGISPT